MEDVEIVYSCINDLITKYFDEIGIKYYSNLIIYSDTQDKIHGLILNDEKYHIEDLDPSIREKIKAIQIIFTEDLTNKNVLRLCRNFQRKDIILIIIGIKWPTEVESLTIEIPADRKIKYPKNIKIYHYELFYKSLGLKGAYEAAFQEIIDLYNKSEFNTLQIYHESSNIKIHGTDELLNDLREKGLIKDSLREYFHS